MAELRAVIIAAVLMALIFVATGNKHRRIHARDDGHHSHSTLCTNNPDMNPFLPPCSTTPATPATTTQPSTTAPSTESSSTTTPTSLQRAHWCRLTNGTYLPLAYTFIQNTCSICQCTAIRTILCKPLQCMPTYCVDSSLPLRKTGQCCTQCLYESVLNSSCSYKDMSFPHGTIIKSVNNQAQCWCQLGNIECRDYAGSPLDDTDLFNDNSVIYIVIIVVIVVLLLGSITCCGCTVFTYYYYQRYQHTIQQAYDEYVNSAGWQPMEEDDPNAVDLSAEEKRLEAEKNQLSNPTVEMVPPPYAAYHQSYVAGDADKQK